MWGWRGKEEAQATEEEQAQDACRENNQPHWLQTTHYHLVRPARNDLSRAHPRVSPTKCWEMPQAGIFVPAPKRMLAHFPTPHRGSKSAAPPQEASGVPRNKPCDAQHPTGGLEDSTSTMSFPLTRPKLTYKVPLCELKQGAPLAGPVGKRHPSLWSDSPSQDTPVGQQIVNFNPHSSTILGGPRASRLPQGPSPPQRSLCSPESGPAAPRTPGPQWFHSTRSPGYPQGLPGVLPGGPG